MMPHGEDQALARREPGNLRFEHGAQLAAVGLFLRAGPILRRIDHLQLRVLRERRPSGRRVPALVVDARVHHDPVEPRGHLGVVAEPVQRSIDLEEHVLGDVFGIVVVAEGAKPRDGELALLERRKVGQVERLGGIGSQIAELIARETGKETRTLVLGHLQRGGSPTTFDRLLALRFGSAAVRAIADGAFGTVVVYSPPNVERRSLEDVVGRTRYVPLESGVIMTARNLGISFGD